MGADSSRAATSQEVSERGQGSTEEEDLTAPENLTLVGSDVVALFPSLTARRTGEIVRRRVLKSDLEFPGFCVKRGLLYIKFNEDKTGDLEVVRVL